MSADEFVHILRVTDSGLVGDARESWMDDALCAQVSTEMFFPEKGGSTLDAKRICGACDVREQCLRYAIDNEERYGIWGGLSERDRRKIQRTERDAA